MHRHSVLPSVIAGTWHPRSPEGVRNALDSYFSACGDVREDWDALVVPHAGWSYSGPCAARAYAGANPNRRRVVLLSPSHRFAMRNLAVLPEADEVSTPLGSIKIDDVMRRALLKKSGFLANDDAHRLEHAEQIQYPFLQYRLKEFALLPVVVGELDAEASQRIADALAPIVAEPETLLVVSSDFIHYGVDFDYIPFRGDVERQVRAVNLEAAQCIVRRDPDEFERVIERTGATICGRNAISLALRALPETARGEILCYSTSADDDRDFRRFVCYCSIGMKNAPKHDKSQGE